MTVDSFQAWKGKFDAEMAVSKVSSYESVKAATEDERPTG